MSIEAEFEIFNTFYTEAFKNSDPSFLVEAVKRNSNCSFCREVFNYYLNNGQIDKNTIPVQAGISYWSKTKVAKIQLATLSSLIKKRSYFLSNNQHCDYAPTIVDLGSGDGLSITQIATQIIDLLKLKKVKIILIDNNEELLNQARIHCESVLEELAIVETLFKDINTINYTELNTNNILLINASSILHEMPFLKKIATLKEIKKITKNLFITELEGNHDLNDVGDNKLIRSVYSFYKSLIDYNTPENYSDSFINFIQGYLIPEALDILFNDYNNRRNYHMNHELWSKVFYNSGWKQNTIKTSINDNLSFITTHLFEA